MRNINTIKSAWRRWQKSRYTFTGTFPAVHFPRYTLAGTFSEIVEGWQNGIEPYRGTQ